MSTVCVLLVRFAFVNHPLERPDAGRVARQTLALAGVTLAAVYIVSVTGP